MGGEALKVSEQTPPAVAPANRSCYFERPDPEENPIGFLRLLVIGGLILPVNLIAG